jgi:hypothetical protein
LPDDYAYDQTKETIKVFAVQQGLADFRWLTLPPLDSPPETKGAKLKKALAETVTGSVTRGESEDINPLNNLLAMIGADLDETPSPKAACIVVDPKQEWVTKQVQIVVKR